MPNEPITPYESSTAIEQHRKTISSTLARLHQAAQKNEDSMRRTSIRVDDLRTLLTYVEALKADIFDAQRAALEDAIASIEFIAGRMSRFDWKQCVDSIRFIITTAEEANSERLGRQQRKRAGSASKKATPPDPPAD